MGKCKRETTEYVHIELQFDVPYCYIINLLSALTLVINMAAVSHVYMHRLQQRVGVSQHIMHIINQESSLII